MKNLQLSISQKLTLGFTLVALIIGGLSFMSVYYINLVKNDGYEVGAHYAPLADAAMEIKLNTANAHIQVEEVINENLDDSKAEEALSLLDDALWYCNAILVGDENDEGKFIASGKKEVIETVKQVTEKLKNFKDISSTLLDGRKSNLGINNEIQESFNKEYKELIKLADNAEELIHEQMEAGVEAFTSNSKQARNFIIIIASVVILLSILISILISRSINKLIGVSVNFAKKVASGNYNSKLNVFRKDEMGNLAEALREMVNSFQKGVSYAKKISEGNLITENVNLNELSPLEESLIDMETKLTEVIQNITLATSQISEGSFQISTAAGQIASGANEQAASTEEVSASMEQMVANINQNTDNANIAETISLKASEGITEGNKSFKITINAMREIAEKISIIGEIAQKTDVLAINAAIEAARAGEHGKGFAVVANEIRKLAENSQKAAGQIDELVTSSVNVAEKSEKLLDELTPEIKKTATLVQEIANAGAEQNSGANQINDAIQELTKVIQENTSSADEMAVNSKNMSLLSDQLKEAVLFFKTGNEHSTEFGFSKKETIRKNNEINIKDSNYNESKSNINLNTLDADDNDFVNF